MGVPASTSIDTFWGDMRAIGSLSNLRQHISVDQRGKVFNSGDEFLIHCFHAHQVLGIESTEADISHEHTLEWLQQTATAIMLRTLAPTQSADVAYAFHRWFMRGCFLYVDLRDAIRYEDGDQVIRLWKHWLVYFL